MRSAVVVGAGIGGLAVAGALARTGWQVTLLERADRIRPGGAGLLLWPSGVAALRALGLGGGLDAITSLVPPTGVRRPDGRWLREPARSPGGGLPVAVHREDLHDALVAGLGEFADVRTGVTVRTARPVQPGRPAVSDGKTTWEADLVIGADGVSGGVRPRLAPNSQPVSWGCTTWRAVIPWYRAPVLPAGAPPAGETQGRGHRFSYAQLGDRGSAGGSRRGGIYWTAEAPGAVRPESAEGQLALLRRWFADWHAPVTELLAATEPDDLVQDGLVELEPMPEAFGFPVGSGGYALLGDAAHALVDHLGLAPSLALEDAATLQVLVKETIPSRSVAEAVTDYSRLRRPRVLTLARQSRRLGVALQANGGTLARARDAALGLAAPRLMDAVTASVAEWRVPDR